MVRLSLSLLATASSAVASAAPLFAQQSFKKITSDPRCLPGTSVKEYQSFELLSHELDTYVSRKIDGSRLVGGVNGDKNLQKLEFCIVSSDRHHCDSIWGTACILENVDYRIRVKGHDKAYLRVDGHYVDVVSSFEDASPLSLSNDNGLGIRIANQYEDGDKNVFATSSAFEEGKPIVLEYPQKNRKRQRFEIIESSKNKCIPQISIKEYEAFELYSYSLDSFVSKKFNQDVLVGGIFGSKYLQQLQFCIVSTDTECNPAYPTNCIYENTQYRYRVHGPEKGYLRVQDGLVRIVPDFEDGTLLTMLWDEIRGVRIAKQNKGSVSVLATTRPGEHLTLEGENKPTDSQFFALATINNPFDNLEKATSPGKCLPDTRFKEGERFAIANRGLGSLVSIHRQNNLLLAGDIGNPEFQQLEFSVIRLDREDMTQGPGDCIYEDALYIFQVYDNGRQIGHLRVERDFLEVVPKFERFTPLYFHQSSSGGLRIGQRTSDGPRVVTTVEPGKPLTFAAPKSGVDRQVFDLLPILRDINEKIERRKCLPDNYAREFQPFVVRDHQFNGFLSKLTYNDDVVGGEAHNQYSKPLKFVVGSYDQDDLKAPGDCIQEDFEYKFEVIEPRRGFLKLVEDRLIVVETEKDATPLYFHKSASQGVRIAKKTPSGPLAVAVTYPGGPTTLEKPESKNERQVFDLLTILRDINEKIERRKCLPDNYAREFQPFVIRNHQFDGFLSKSIYSDDVIGGEKHNQDSTPLKFVVGAYDQDDLKAPGDCIQEDFEYKFEVIEPRRGFLKLVEDRLIVVETEKEATLLYFHKSASQGVRIAQKTRNGPLAVAVTFPGGPTTLEKPESKNQRQVFDLLTTVPSSDKHALW